MPTNHFAYSAVPNLGETAGLRSGLVGRYAYCLGTAESAGDFVAVDPDTGDVCPALIQDGKLFGLDSTDTTTAASATCLVSYEGKRYKLNSIGEPFSVLDNDLTAPPVSPSPSEGDAYLLYNTPSGDWAGKLGYIAIYTAWEWEFVLPPIGYEIYVEDEDAFYYRDTNGDWIKKDVLADQTIPLSAMIWDGRVENQTTTSPPATWSKGEAYIIGPSATGDWLGQDAKLAIAESDGVLADGDEFTIYAHVVGRKVYDKDLATEYRWNGTAWAKAAGDFKIVLHVYTSTQNFTKDADCFGVMFHGIGGGGGGAGAASSTGGAGGATTFGSHVSAGGGQGGGDVGGAGGTGNGDLSLVGSVGFVDGVGESVGPFGSVANPVGKYGRAGLPSSGRRGGGGGNYSRKWVEGVDLSSIEAVTIGAGGTAGTGASAGTGGWAMVEEYIRT